MLNPNSSTGAFVALLLLVGVGLRDLLMALNIAMSFGKTMAAGFVFTTASVQLVHLLSFLLTGIAYLAFALQVLEEHQHPTSFGH